MLYNGRDGMWPNGRGGALLKRSMQVRILPCQPGRVAERHRR